MCVSVCVSVYTDIHMQRPSYTHIYSALLYMYMYMYIHIYMNDSWVFLRPRNSLRCPAGFDIPAAPAIRPERTQRENNCQGEGPTPAETGGFIFRTDRARRRREPPSSSSSSPNSLDRPEPGGRHARNQNGCPGESSPTRRAPRGTCRVTPAAPRHASPDPPHAGTFYSAPTFSPHHRQSPRIIGKVSTQPVSLSLSLSLCPSSPARNPASSYLKLGPFHLPVSALHLEAGPLVLDVVQDSRDSVMLGPGKLRSAPGPRRFLNRRWTLRLLLGRETPAAAAAAVRSRAALVEQLGINVASDGRQWLLLRSRGSPRHDPPSGAGMFVHCL